MSQAAPSTETPLQVRRVSDATRSEFQIVLDLRRASLTKHEVEFLTDLLKDGNEEELSKASNILSNPSLFPAKTKSEDEEDDDEDKDRVKPSSSFGSNSQTNSNATGSSRRRESLQLRKSSAVHGQIWKAHQNGLAISRQASRRSIFQKEQSLSRLSVCSGPRLSSKQSLRAGSIYSDITTLDWDSDSESEDEGEIVLPHLPPRQNLRNSLRGSNYSRSSLRMSGYSLHSLRSSTRSSLRSSTTRRGSNLTISSFSTEGSQGSANSRGSISKRRSVVLAAPGETETQEQSPASRRHTLFQHQKSVPHINLMEIPEENDELDSPTCTPKSERPTPALLVEELGLPEDKEEKKMNDEEMAQSQEEQEWLQHLSVRRASENTYMGEGMEVGLSPFLQQQMPDDIMSESETYHDEDEDDEIPTGSQREHDMIMRRASVNTYNGEGMEISDWDMQEDLEDLKECLQSYRQSTHHISSALFEDEEELVQAAAGGIQASSSFGELQSMDRLPTFPDVDTNQGIKRSYSEDELAAVLTVHLHHTKCKLEKRISGGTAATADMSDDEEDYDDFEYDAWAEEVNHGLNNLPFRILGTSAEDVDSHPHVLSPPLMESLQEFMPMSKTSDNYWMKYSMVRDGASIHTLLQHARGAKYSILAIETVDGEVMGSFTNEPWRKTWSYFGGGESFLWRMRHSRKSKCNSIIDVAHLESEIDVYPYTGENHCVQFCTSRKIAVGGGSPDQSKSTDSLPPTTEEGEAEVREHDWGYGIALQSDLMHGSSSPCVTFGSPSLSKLHSDGSLFEIINIELWTMTPCYSEADAQKLELGQMFLEQQSFHADQSNDDLNELFGSDARTSWAQR